MGPDKRTSARVMRPLDLECLALTKPPTPIVARISDLSASGAFLESLNPLAAGTRLALRFMLGEHIVTVAAEVVHLMPQFGMGVRFLDLSAESRVAIENLLGISR
jgi:hypothetical protein